MAATMLGCVGAGYWIDRKFGTSPVFLLLGAAFGLFAVFYHLYRMLMEPKK